MWETPPEQEKGCRKRWGMGAGGTNPKKQNRG